ncbi:MAG: hypothetical protein JXK07_12125 [Spirochaetes bacterium]|nr:hypothetical protein [Spirochaetota bacterium]
MTRFLLRLRLPFLTVFILSVFLSDSFFPLTRYYIGLVRFENRKDFVNFYKKNALTQDEVQLLIDDQNHYQLYYNNEYRTYRHATVDRESPRGYLANSSNLFDNSRLWISQTPLIFSDPLIPIKEQELEDELQRKKEEELARLKELQRKKFDFDTEYIYRFESKYYPYRIITERKAGLEHPLRKSDNNRALTLIQSIPDYGSVPYRAPIILFFNKRILLSSIIGNVSIKINDKPVSGTIRVFAYAHNRSAISIVPDNYNTGSNSEDKDTEDVDDSSTSHDKGVVYVSTKLRDETGKNLDNKIELVFKYHKPFNRNIDYESFENSDKIFCKAGDVGIIKGDPWVIEAVEGSNYMGISNGNMVITNSSSVASKTSYFQFNKEKLSKLSFSYNFVSSEFNEFIANPYGDIALLFISGKDYQKSFVISSVSYTGEKNRQIPYGEFLGMPAYGDIYVGQTDWKSFVMRNIYDDGPVTITFIVTDLRNNDYTSVLLLDNLQAR